MKMRHYKFQALLTLASPAADVPSNPHGGFAGGDLPPGEIRRMVVKGEHHTTHGSQFFSALVANNGDGTEWLDEKHAIVTVMVLGEELAEYFSVGDRFSLWSGHELAGGTVTRRLFI